MLAPSEEAVLPRPEYPVPLVAVRSTLLLASLEAARAEGLLDQYLEIVNPATREALFGAVAATWLPVALAQAHYAALDALTIAPAKQVELGRRVLDRISGTLLGTAIKLASNAGATPWTILPHVDRFWARGFQGSTLAVYKTGPKDARLELDGLPLLAFPYFRNALRGLISGVLGLFCTRCVVAEMRDPAALPTSRALRVQWA